MKKRNKWNKNIDSIALIQKTEGFNGADLEAVVKDTIEMAFIEGKEFITTEDLIHTVEDTKSISNTLKDKIAQIKDTVKRIDIKPASLPDKTDIPNKNYDEKTSHAKKAVKVMGCMRR